MQTSYICHLHVLTTELPSALTWHGFLGLLLQSHPGRDPVLPFVHSKHDTLYQALHN